MKKKLAFNIPFSGFAPTTFINCFASAYMFLENIEAVGETEYDCQLRENGQCSGCGNCGRTPVAIGSSVPVCPAFFSPTRRRRTAQQANDVIVSGLSKQSIPSIVKPSLDRGSPQKGFGISQRRFPARLAVRRP